MLIEVRCPLKTYVKKYKANRTCNRLAVRVEPGSAGEAYCPSCRQTFFFEVSGDYQPPEKAVLKLQKEEGEDAEPYSNPTPNLPRAIVKGL